MDSVLFLLSISQKHYRTEEQKLHLQMPRDTSYTIRLPNFLVSKILFLIERKR